MNLHQVTLGALFLGFFLLPSRAVTEERGPTVRVTIKGKKFCLGEPGTASGEHQLSKTVTLRLNGAAEYTNPEKTPLIIPTIHELSKIIVSRNHQSENAA